MMLCNRRIVKALIRLSQAQAGLCLCCLKTPEDRGSPVKGRLTNSGNPDEMMHNAAFHQGLHCKL